MSFVASCHHRVVQCFRMHGNAKHGQDHKVSLSEFQAAIRARHGAVASEAGHDAASSASVDFASRALAEDIWGRPRCTL